jgi:hypothetical protein
MKHGMGGSVGALVATVRVLIWTVCQAAHMGLGIT